MFPLDSDLAPSLIGRLTEPFSFERRQICPANHDLKETYTDSKVFKDTKQGITFSTYMVWYMLQHTLLSHVEFLNFKSCHVAPNGFKFY